MLVTHGGLGGYVKPKPRPEPLSTLHKHLEEHNIKMIDVFRKFDPDNSTTVPEKESYRGFIYLIRCFVSLQTLKIYFVLLLFWMLVVV